MNNLNRYLDSLSADEVQVLHDIALATVELKITNGNPEALEFYEQVLQPAIRARACDGWLYRWHPQIYYN